MQCPTDGSVLVMSERSGIEIDYCPTCRGVWLDRGELDKIIERSVSEAPAAQPRYEERRPQEPRYEERRKDYDRDYDKGSYKKRKKESWLSELFD